MSARRISPSRENVSKISCISRRYSVYPASVSFWGIRRGQHSGGADAAVVDQRVVCAKYADLPRLRRRRTLRRSRRSRIRENPGCTLCRSFARAFMHGASSSRKWQTGITPARDKIKTASREDTVSLYGAGSGVERVRPRPARGKRRDAPAGGR